MAACSRSRTTPVSVGISSARRILELINTETDLDQNTGGYHGELDGSLEFKQVTFSYNGGTPALEDVSFRVQPGQTIAIVGQTGAGKSIVVGALGLLLGERASAESIRSGASKATVEGVFDVAKRKNVLAMLAEQGIEADDGLLILRRSDITDVRRSETDQFQQWLLEQEGIRPGAQTPEPSLQLHGWQSVITQPSALFPLMILEQELGPEPAFSIGRAEKATAAQVEFLSFSGTARWHAKVQRLKYSHLTSLQVNTRYANFYQRHFDRNAG